MEMLKDKNALVIGGGSGMGAAVAVALAEAGARVTIAGRRLEKLEEVTGLSVIEIQTRTVDVSDRVSLDALFSWFDEESGDLDILVNAAGINVPKRSMAELSPDDWDAVLKVNLTGAYDCLRMALDRMRPRKYGLVVMINSVSGKRSNPLGGVAYNASKFGMTGLGSCVAEEERENGIRITNVFPGEVNTPILDQRPVPPSAEHRAEILQPQDIAEAVMMLARLHPRAHIPELVIKPTSQSYV
ncbi:MAG: SDR family NAD(P)-dependent oxidoreductase [Verrucomicrobia bacterium]|jgi:NAD(P)-dependent dehydrogenase (short-subunit alcohol dehydrogenase family)|nr:SDR family oxidoreductase [Verrucomicrobiota bacterium]MDA0724183.1 SDR family NAD(P)-dependent oxidoreductase [Verrucomicrobiota bacterium]MDA1048717.1 SDR family NAD(P)-dependent oxidoreductase [Verrucomicrobiota bacterium]